MDLSHLDDPEPLRTDAQMRARVVATARRRRRTRIVTESIAGVLVVAAIVTSIVATRSGSDHVRVAVTSENSSTTTPPDTQPATTTPTVAPGHVGVRLELDSTTVVPGGTITGTLVFENPSANFVYVTDGHDCLMKYQVVVDVAYPADVGWTDECATPHANLPSTMYLEIPPGTSRIAFRTGATKRMCSQTPHPDYPTCKPDGSPPDLPAGRAYVYFVAQATHGTQADLDVAAAVAITIT